MQVLLFRYLEAWVLWIILGIAVALNEPSNTRTSTTGSTWWNKRNLATIQKIYNLTVCPHNIPILQHGASAVPTGLFNQQATGRVSPIGNFSGFDDSIEYFFALAPAPNKDPGPAIYDAEIVAFTSGCANVAASLVYLRTDTVDPVTGKLNASMPTSTLSQIAFWRFDDIGAVLKYQAFIPTLQAWSKAALGIDFDDFFTAKSTALRICPVIQQRCQGANQQYANVVDRVAELEGKPFGSFDEAWGDNVAGRTIHLVLTQIRPEAHCAHVVPDGVSPPGDHKCVNIDYSKEYFDDRELFGAPEGDVFTCD